jgi:hypothetical protein
MSPTTAATVAAILVIATLVGNAFMKGTARQFKDDPAASAYHGEVLRGQTTETSRDVADKQRAMMDRMKERIDRNRKF